MHTRYVASMALIAILLSVDSMPAAMATSPDTAKTSPSPASAKGVISKLDSALLQAAEQDDPAQVDVLLKKHANPDVSRGDGTTALHWAAYNDDVKMARQLLAYGASAGPHTRARSLTPLHIAAESGDVQLIGALLKAGALVNTTNSSGTTPLMIAAASGSSAAVELLLTNGADINAREGAFGQTALFFAADRNRADVVRLLVSKGADLKVKTTIKKLARISVGVNGEVLDEKKSVPTIEKRDRDHAETKSDAVESAAHSGAKANTFLTAGDDAKPDEGKKPAAAPGDKVKDAYGFTAADRKKRVYGTQQIGGMTALLLAARDGQKAAVEALLDIGDDIDQTSDTDHATPLLIALINGHYDLAQFLLERGANAKLTTTDGVGPLYALIDVQWAPHTWYPQPVTANEHVTYLELAKELLTRGADPNATIAKRLWYRSFANDETWFDVEGSTPFLRAALAGDLAAMQLLVENGANPNVATKSEDTPLMAAAGIGWAAYWTSNAPASRLDAVQFCLAHGANVNAKDVKGYTALHGAAFRGDNAMVKYLIASGADVHAKTKDGDTVADVANGLFEHAIPHEDTVALLEGLGSSNSHNCRSNECVVAPNEDKSTAAKSSGDATAKQNTTPVSATLEARPK
jgi:ankyrin repeat protein